jgi:ribonuclease HI
MSKKTKNNYFVVWDGLHTGIYDSWEKCKVQINGYANAKYKGFATQKEAKEALQSPYADYIGKNKKIKDHSKTVRGNVGSPITESISVDAACSGNPGLMEYRGVYTKNGRQLFHEGPFEEGTNNIGEFLALVHGLALLKQKNSPLPIYTDSKTALSWVRNKRAKTELQRTDKNKSLFYLIERAEKWLRENSFTTTIIKWETSAWGEIPADFGRK